MVLRAINTKVAVSSAINGDKAISMIIGVFQGDILSPCLSLCTIRYAAMTWTEWDAKSPTSCLTHVPPVPHICTSELIQHCFRWRLVAYSAPIHHPNQWWLIVNWTLKNKLPWNSDQNTNLFIHKNVFKNVVCKWWPCCPRGRWVNVSYACYRPL